MATEKFTPGSLDNRLKDLNSTMQSIQGVSQWLITHKKYAKTIVGVWFREIQKGSYNTHTHVHSYVHTAHTLHTHCTHHTHNQHVHAGVQLNAVSGPGRCKVVCMGTARWGGDLGRKGGGRPSSSSKSSSRPPAPL